MEKDLLGISENAGVKAEENANDDRKGEQFVTEEQNIDGADEIRRPKCLRDNDDAESGGFRALADEDEEDDDDDDDEDGSDDFLDGLLRRRFRDSDDDLMPFDRTDFKIEVEDDRIFPEEEDRFYFDPSCDDSALNVSQIIRKVSFFSRASGGQKTIEAIENGLRRYPASVELLEAGLRYAMQAEKTDKQDEFFQTLMDRVPQNRWTWRTYESALTYLELNAVENEQECRSVIAAYKSAYRDNEKPLIALAKLEEKLGNREEAIEILEAAVRTRPNAPCSAKYLADALMKRGLFSAVVKTCGYAMTAVNSLESATKAFLYFLLLKTIAEESIVRQRIAASGMADPSAIQNIINDYNKVEDAMRMCNYYCDEIKMRRAMLMGMGITD